jgi:hypothetical protein
MKRLYKNLVAIMVVTSIMFGSVGPAYAAPAPVVQGMTFSSKCMFGITALTAAAGIARYWWVSNTADRITKAQELVNQPKWVHNFKVSESPKANARQLIKHFNEARNGIAVLADNGAERRLSSINLEELIEALIMHQAALDIRVREIEKIVGDALLPDQGALQDRVDRVRQIMNEEDIEHREWQPWIKSEVMRWFKKPNRNAALACLKKLYSKIYDINTLVTALEAERAEFFRYSSYQKTAILLADIKQKKSTQQFEPANKGLWHIDLDAISSSFKENDTIVEKVKHIKYKFLNDDTKLRDVISSIEVCMNDLLKSIQCKILSGEIRPEQQRSNRDSGDREVKRQELIPNAVGSREPSSRRSYTSMNDLV